MPQLPRLQPLVDTTTPRFAEAWVTADDVHRPWLPYEYTVGRLLYALFVDPFLALTVGFLYQIRKGYREPWHETYAALRIRRRLIARDRKILGLEDDEGVEDDEVLQGYSDLDEYIVGTIEAEAATLTRREEVQAAEALECPYQAAQAALDEVKTGIPDGNYKTIADALMHAYRAKRQ
tara:strand:+ start:331 stop:864 length:534 start_codon:yes stop_codon:yes gene_type:complete